MEPVVKRSEEKQLDFSGTLPGKLNKDTYNLIAIDIWTKLPTAIVVSNTTADIAIKFMQRYISNNGIPQMVEMPPSANN